MNKPLIIWQFLLEQLQKGIPAMLLYVLESKGSSPGRQGFFMAVSTDGLMQGSIGGGVMEHKFVELSKERLQEERNKDQEDKEQGGREKKKSTSIRKQIHDKAVAKNQSGMICSGEQTILLYEVMKEDISTIQSIISCLQQRKNGLLELSPYGLSFNVDQHPPNDFYYRFTSESDWVYKEKVGFKNRLYIIGGGHCALAFSKIMSMMDFYIHLVEDRKNLNTFEANNYVQKKLIVPNYNELNRIVEPGHHTYVVVMTFGYRSDDVAVRALLKKDLAYFGLLGSAAKIDKMFADYRKEGILESDLDKIQAPVGLPINSQTSEEIAISIAAQIIEVKNRKTATNDEPVISTGLPLIKE